MSEISHIYVVECREYTPEIYKQKHRYTMRCHAIFFASSLEKALKFCKENTDYDEHNNKKPWWFYVYRQAIDKWLCDDEQYALDWNANPIMYQPDGYEDNGDALVGDSPPCDCETCTEMFMHKVTEFQKTKLNLLDLMNSPE